MKGQCEIYLTKREDSKEKFQEEGEKEEEKGMVESEDESALLVWLKSHVQCMCLCIALFFFCCFVFKGCAEQVCVFFPLFLCALSRDPSDIRTCKHRMRLVFPVLFFLFCYREAFFFEA